MSDAQTSNQATVKTPRPHSVDMKLEVAVLAVSDVDRAKLFYTGLGWRLDADFVRADGSRAVQLTPPSSPASIQLGSEPLLYLVVTDIGAARAELEALGAEVSEVFHRGPNGHLSGPDPDRRSYGSLATFRDPDGNAWLIQEVTKRLPGRVDGDTTFASSRELASALRRAAAAHGGHEKRTGKHDDNWADWYADYVVREQAGKDMPE